MLDRVARSVGSLERKDILPPPKSLVSGVSHLGVLVLLIPLLTRDLIGLGAHVGDADPLVDGGCCLIADRNLAGDGASVIVGLIRVLEGDPLVDDGAVDEGSSGQLKSKVDEPSIGSV